MKAAGWRALPGRSGLGILASAVLVALYARGGIAWVLGFVMLVPWLLTLDERRTLAGTVAAAALMAVAYTAAALAWFGIAIGGYTQWGPTAGLALLLLTAPLLQPQFIAYAVVRRLVGLRHGVALSALAAAAAWVATEAFVPKLLGDTLGHGLYPSPLLRQAADLGGTAGLTLLLLLANEAAAAALARRRQGVRAVAQPLALLVLVPLALTVYGLAVLREPPVSAGPPLRVGLVQSNIVDYEGLRREKGVAAVVREVLDVHYAMSYDAVERQGVHAVLWSETVYPTTFGRPKSEAGAELDAEILSIVQAAGVPFVFGTYDRDEAGEYNAAAFVAPGAGIVGLYRKTRPFPFTEHVPGWLDGPTLRRWLPWAGGWLPGSGARVFPLRLADGREVPVLPLICLDDVDAALAIEGARLGARAIVGLSNDAWFTADGQGARLHHAVAAFRSIETRLPQFRVTTSGYSAVIDATGQVQAGSELGQRTLVVGELPVGEPRTTLMVAWGDWVGRAAAGFLLLLAVLTAWRRWAPHESPGAAADAHPPAPAGRAAQAGTPSAPTDPAADLGPVALLPPMARLAAGALQALAMASLLGLAAAFVLGEMGLPPNPLARLRLFAWLVLVPGAAAWLLVRAYAAKVHAADGSLVFTRGRHRVALAGTQVTGVMPWWLPLPGPGVWLRLADGRRWAWGLAVADPGALQRALRGAGATALPTAPQAWPWRWAQARAAQRPGRLDAPLLKFGMLPLALALPAFRLHQHIAFGSSFGELQTFGAASFALGLALWWATWVMGVALCAAVLRAAVEAATLAAVLLRPDQAPALRQVLLRLAQLLLYGGLPLWLLLRLLGW